MVGGEKAVGATWRQVAVIEEALEHPVDGVTMEACGVCSLLLARGRATTRYRRDGLLA